MAEHIPVIDVTEEFFTMDSHELNAHIRGLGKGALVGVSYPILDENGERYNQSILRKTKAFVERAPERDAVVIATEAQVSIEPNVFCSGVLRVTPDIDT
jgi:hypothetical protein